MTLSAENSKSNLGSDSLLISAAASMNAAATTTSRYHRQRDTHNALAILEEAKFNAALDSDEPGFYAAATLATIAPIYGFRRYFREHADEPRYTRAFADAHLDPAEQAVRSIGLETMEVYARIGRLLKAGEASSPSIFPLRKQREELARVMAHQATVLECIDPSRPKGFAQISLPDYLKPIS